MDNENRKIVRASDVMQRQVFKINGMATAREAVLKMQQEKVSSLIVEKRHPDDAWGIVVIQDLISKVIIPGREAVDVHVYEIMTKPVITVPADMDIRYVARLIQRAKIRRAPVEENKELVGMVSLTSLILENNFI